MSSPTYRIAPSILSADFARLGAEVEAVLAAGADIVHFDVMDNHYVPNLTIGPLVCAALRKHGIKAPIDVHLMIEPVDRIVPDFAEAGATYISFHPEASLHVDRTIELIREHGCKPGLVFNPATPLEYLDYTLEKLDMVLIMSVNPGFGGQKFIRGALAKLAEVRRLIDAYRPAVDALKPLAPDVLSPMEREQVENAVAVFVEAGAPEGLARQVAALRPLTTVADLCDLA